MMLNRYKKILAFFAHPDDEALAAGATISKLTTSGCEVHVAIPNTGIHSRRNIEDQFLRDQKLSNLRSDCEKALAVLGVRLENIYLGEILRQ